MQCFEGLRSAMNETWERIRKSRGHADISEIMNVQVEARSFGEWHIGYTQTSESQPLTLSTNAWRRMARQPGTSDGLVLLRAFSRRSTERSTVPPAVPLEDFKEKRVTTNLS
jgi:Sensors of blue-light using FAD